MWISQRLSLVKFVNTNLHKNITFLNIWLPVRGTNRSDHNQNSVELINPLNFLLKKLRVQSQ